MKLICSAFLLLATGPMVFGASKEMTQLMRDVELLQGQVEKMQRTLDMLSGQSQTTSESARQASIAAGVLEGKIQETLRQMQSSVTAPVQGVGSKLDQMAEDFRAVREAVLDMNSRLSKLDAKVSDLQNAMNVIKNPVPAPAPLTRFWMSVSRTPKLFSYRFTAHWSAPSSRFVASGYSPRM